MTSDDDENEFLKHHIGLFFSRQLDSPYYALWTAPVTATHTYILLYYYRTKYVHGEVAGFRRTNDSK